MGFTSFDDFQNQVTVNKKIMNLLFSKTIVTGATSAAGRWHEILSGGGTGGAMTLTGTAGTGIVMNKSSVGALPLNADLTPATRHLISMTLNSPHATLVPAWVMLTDILHIYPSCVLTGTSSTPSNHPTWTGVGDTRMTNAIGAMLSLIITTATTAGNAQITPTYKDQDGNDAASLRSLYAPSTASPIGSLYGDANAVVTLGAPIMALNAGDTGVRQLNSYTINTGGTSGVGCFILHRPIAMLPISLVNLVGERDFVAGLPLFPRIHDDACLGLLVQIGGAMTTGGIITGNLNYAWGG